MGILAHAFNPSLWEAEAGGSLNARLAWSTDVVPGQPRLHSETLPQKPTCNISTGSQNPNTLPPRKIIHRTDLINHNFLKNRVNLTRSPCLNISPVIFFFLQLVECFILYDPAQISSLLLVSLSLPRQSRAQWKRKAFVDKRKSMRKV